MTNVTTEMHGKYKCVIKNDYGKIEDECQVTVNCMCAFVSFSFLAFDYVFFYWLFC